jgi:hypothetical protein
MVGYAVPSIRDLLGSLQPQLWPAPHYGRLARPHECVLRYAGATVPQATVTPFPEL